MESYLQSVPEVLAKSFNSAKDTVELMRNGYHPNYICIKKKNSRGSLEQVGIACVNID